MWAHSDSLLLLGLWMLESQLRVWSGEMKHLLGWLAGATALSSS